MGLRDNNLADLQTHDEACPVERDATIPSRVVAPYLLDPLVLGSDRDRQGQVFEFVAVANLVRLHRGGASVSGKAESDRDHAAIAWWRMGQTQRGDEAKRLIRTREACM